MGMDNNTYDRDVVNIFWTGGWDSTFRILQLIFQEKKVVQPYYLVRPQECTGKEIDTIHDIRRYFSRNYPEISSNILPIKHLDVSEVKENKIITEEYERIKSYRYISPQYEMLARFCNYIDVYPIELCVLKKEVREYFTSDSQIFKYFSFPLRDLTKTDIHDLSIENNWMDIMNLTWFCRRPKKGKACGFCAPCTDSVIGGMGWRLPLKARIIAHIQIPFRKWWRKNYLQQSDGFAKHIMKLLKHRV